MPHNIITSGKKEKCLSLSSFWTFMNPRNFTWFEFFNKSQRSRKLRKERHPWVSAALNEPSHASSLIGGRQDWSYITPTNDTIDDTLKMNLNAFNNKTIDERYLLMIAMCCGAGFRHSCKNSSLWQSFPLLRRWVNAQYVSCNIPFYDVVVILNTFSHRLDTDGQIRDSKLAPEYVIIIPKMCRIILTNM